MVLYMMLLLLQAYHQEAEELLHGIVPPEWYGNDTLLKEFLASFEIPQYRSRQGANSNNDH